MTAKKTFLKYLLRDESGVLVSAHVRDSALVYGTDIVTTVSENGLYIFAYNKPVGIPYAAIRNPKNEMWLIEADLVGPARGMMCKDADVMKSGVTTSTKEILFLDENIVFVNNVKLLTPLPMGLVSMGDGYTGE